MVAMMVKGKTPVDVGVPVMSPVAELSERPVGRAPVSVKVVGIPGVAFWMLACWVVMAVVTVKTFGVM